MTRHAPHPGWYLAVFVLAAGVYTNTLGYGAAWDDTRFVFESGARGGVTAIPDLFASPFLSDIPPGRSPYRPVTASSYAIDWTLGSGNASFFHWTNVGLHATISALVLGLLVLLGASPGGAVAGAAVFAVHPVHVEAVANLAGRAELLVACFLLLAILAYLGSTALGVRRDPTRDTAPGPVATAVILVAFGLGLGAKENAIVLPGLLVVVEALRPAARGPLRARLGRRLPLGVGLVLVAAGYMLTRQSVLGTFTTFDVAPFILTLDPATRISTAVANWSEYARLMVAPADLVIDYGPAVVMPAAPGSPRFFAGSAVGLGVLVLAVVAWSRTRLPAVGLAWFAVAVFPVTNLVIPIAQWLAERFLYLPSVGLSLAVAGAVPLLRERASTPGARRALAGAGLIVLVAFSVRSWTRNASWETTETVVQTLVEEHPEAFRAQWLLGRALLASGRPIDGMTALQRARDLNPNAIELHLEVAEWELRLGRPGDARRTLEELPTGRHPGRDALLARALHAVGRPGAADSVIYLGLTAFPANEALLALRDSLTDLTTPPEPSR
ncbi:MAG: hypothetical protein RJQ04_01925 [Longimicrobiales bacterium]